MLSTHPALNYESAEKVKATLGITAAFIIQCLWTTVKDLWTTVKDLIPAFFDLTGFNDQMPSCHMISEAPTNHWCVRSLIGDEHKFQ